MKPHPSLSKLCLAAAMVLGGCKPATAPLAAVPPEVLVTAAEAQDVPIVSEWLGTLDGSVNADIRARVVGYLLEQKYTEGGVVKKGDVLFTIDPRPFQAQLAQAKAQAAQAEAQQGRSEAEFQKQKELFEKKVVSQRDYDNASQSNLANLANVEAARAAAQKAQLDLDFTKVTAPVDGVAGIAKVGVGDLVGSGANVVLTSISTLDPIKVKFPVSEQEYLGAAAKINEALATPEAEREAKAELVLADGSVFPHKGKFFAADRQVDLKTGTITIAALFPNPGNVLRPGQFARVRLVTRTQAGAVLVPQRAVAEMQGSYSLAVVGADGKAEIRPVKVGARVGSQWIIEQGLQAGEKVVVEGIQKVRSGAPVSAKPWAPTK